jgi:hypothetical protein
MDAILDFLVIAGAILRAGLQTAVICLLTLWWGIATDSHLIDHNSDAYLLLMLAIWILLTYLNCLRIAAKRNARVYDDY